MSWCTTVESNNPIIIGGPGIAIVVQLMSVMELTIFEIDECKLNTIEEGSLGMYLVDVSEVHLKPS